MVKVLIAEDNLVIADFLEEMLIDAGYTVCGIAATVAEAVALGNAHHPDLAILDMCLRNDELGTEIPPLLTDCDRVGILYASGSDTNQPDDRPGRCVHPEALYRPRAAGGAADGAADRGWHCDLDACSHRCPYIVLKAKGANA